MDYRARCGALVLCGVIAASCGSDRAEVGPQGSAASVPSTSAGSGAGVTAGPGDVGASGVGSLPFGLARCAADPWTWISADPSFYRDEPVYSRNEQPVDEVRAWASAQPGFEDIWVDQARNGWISVGFSEGASLRQLDLEAEFPGVGVAAVDVEHSLSELETLRSDVTDAMDGTPLGFGIGASVPAGLVILSVGVLDEETLAPLAEFAGRPLCIEGVDPADAIPDRPQPTEGPGWRLLGVDHTGPGYRTGVATTDDQYSALWRQAELCGDPPPVDFATEIVIWFGSVYGGGCEHRMDDVVVDADSRLVHGQFVVPGPPPGCNADANPKAYVVAVERSHLPVGSFAVQLDASPPPAGAPEERTIVSVDLRAPGSTATDDQIGFDPELVDTLESQPTTD